MHIAVTVMYSYAVFLLKKQLCHFLSPHAEYRLTSHLTHWLLFSVGVGGMFPPSARPLAHPSSTMGWRLGFGGVLPVVMRFLNYVK